MEAYGHEVASFASSTGFYRWLHYSLVAVLLLMANDFVSFSNLLGRARNEGSYFNQSTRVQSWVFPYRDYLRSNRDVEEVRASSRSLYE
jgi:hypothetical protein